MSVFQNTRHNFGAKDSPTCANYNLRRTAVDNKNRYLGAAYAVSNSFHMDDYLVSVKSPETALTLSRSLVELLKLVGLNHTKFISNVLNLSFKLYPLKPTQKTGRSILPLRFFRKPHCMLSFCVLRVRLHRSCRPVYRTRKFATERYLAIEWPTVGRPPVK